MEKHTNKLIHESSPYLLQHAHNPVNWFAWGEEALALAKKEDKLILVSIGYSACHWCHVMERESFEDEATAEIMNNNFINIKVDREERPDLDHVFMDAVQTLTGGGGWPLNIFLTPSGKPFYGGTYFPPKRAFNRVSWQEVLLAIHKMFKESRSELDNQAATLIEHLEKANGFGLNIDSNDGAFSNEQLEELFKNILQKADLNWGGFGKAPKFPQSFVIQFLLRYHHITKNKEAIQQALLSIDKMIDGGIYDQLSGGFARYATDEEWLIPHFEKMLYDNALLVSVISEAYQLTGQRRYKEVIDETIQFVQAELMNSHGGFYAALDADSESVEGKFYVWSHKEVHELLQDDANIFCNFFDVSFSGNWEGENILRRKKTEAAFSLEYNIELAHLQKIIKTGKEKLLFKRNERVRPRLDDKVILSWNALMCTALCKAFAATQNEDYKLIAIKNMDFLLQNFVQKNSYEFFHTWKNGKAIHPSFLDDYSFLIQALIQLQEITGNTIYLLRAKEIAQFVVENYKDEAGYFFYYTHQQQTETIIRKKEVYDGALPSGNAIMADNLHRLAIYFDLPIWNKISNDALNNLSKAIINYPTSFGTWACLLLEKIEGTNEIAIVGEKANQLLSKILGNYFPHKVIMSSIVKNDNFPILKGKKEESGKSIFLCKNQSCKNPVASVKEFLTLMGSN